MVLFNPKHVVHIFPKGICSKVNIVTQLELELAYNNVAVQHVSHYTIETLPNSIL